MTVAPARGTVSWITLLVVVVITASGCSFFVENGVVADEREPAAPSGATGGKVAVFSSDVVVYEPLSGDTVNESFAVSGRTVDGVTSVLIALEDSSSVPFATTTFAVSGGYFDGSMKISSPPTRTGAVVITARFSNNAAGSRISVPVVFGSYRGKAVSVYFSNVEKDPTLKSCDQVYPVARDVLLEPSVEQNALDALLRGPTDGEVVQGYITNFPEEAIPSPKIVKQNGEYSIDFKKSAIEGVSGECRIQALRAQIEQTLKQFSTSTTIIITVDGKPSIF